VTLHRPRCLFSLAALSLILCANTAFAYTAGHLWSKRFGSTQPTEYGHAVTTDYAGNVIVIGTFYSADFGGGLITGAGFSDGFVAKFDASGNHLWSRRMSGTSDDWLSAVTTDPSGNIYVAGTFWGTADFGNGPLVSAGNTDISVTKLTPGGTAVFSKRFGSTGDDWGNAIAVDNSGNIFVSGRFMNTVSFGGTPLVSAGATDAFLVKFDTAGNHLLSNRYGSTGGEEGHSLAVDYFGNVVLTGAFTSASVSFGGTALTGAGGNDVFLARYNNTLTHLWSKGFGNTGSDVGQSVAVTPAGEVCFTGRFTGIVNFGGSALDGGSASEIVIARYASDGTHQWSQRFGGAATNEYSYGVAMDFLGRPFVIGEISSTVDFGGGPLIPASGDVVVAHFDANGVHRWSKHFGGSLSDTGRGIATDPMGDVFVTGGFYNTMDLGGGPLTSAGNIDIFLAKFAGPPPPPLITSIADIPNDQGRQVKIRFDRSAFDGVVAEPVIEYEAYRMDAPGPAHLELQTAGRSERELLAEGWTFVGSVPAHGEPGYGINVPTIGDSTIALGPYDTFFYVRASTDNSLLYYDSPAMPGYSVDNLAPAVPLNFAYNAGALTWKESRDADFDYFTVYGSALDAFGSAVVIDYTVAPTLNVLASPYAHYYVTATDHSGNEGKPAKIVTPSGVGGTPKNYVLSVSNYPNPFNPSTTVNYTIPSRGTVTLSIFDARGTLITTLFSGTLDAGAHSTPWNGLTLSGNPAGSGVYFARIEHNGSTRSKKLVLLK